MMILAFARTTAALVAGRKSVTRRLWSSAYHAKVKRALDKALAAGEPGLRMQAWSAGPHRGGKRVGEILLTSLTREPTRLIPDSDWEAEGFAYMQEHGLDLEKEFSVEECWHQWRRDKDLVTSVLRFDTFIDPGVSEADFLPNRPGGQQ